MSKQKLSSAFGIFLLCCSTHSFTADHSTIILKHRTILFDAAEKAFKKSNYEYAKSAYGMILTTPELAAHLDEKALIRAKINYAETLLALSEYEEGHIQFESRLNNPDANRKPLQKKWNGVPINTLLLVRGEHGIGDTFFFMRYIKCLHDLNIPVCIRERGFLKPLLSRQAYIKQIVTSDEEEKATPYSFDIYTMSLPRYISKNGLDAVKKADDIPYADGYIEPRADLLQHCKLFHFSENTKLHVFIAAYRASKNVAGECRYLQRDCSMQQLINTLGNMQHVQLHCLAVGEHYPIMRTDYNKRKDNNELKSLDEMDIIADEDFCKIRMYQGDIDNTRGAFEDTAALMCTADYVVTVDTSTAMLAGALGTDHVKNLAILLPKKSDWRWGHGQPKTTPFFTNAQLFWQKEQGDWSIPLVLLRESIRHQAKIKMQQISQNHTTNN